MQKLQLLSGFLLPVFVVLLSILYLPPLGTSQPAPAAEVTLPADAVSFRVLMGVGDREPTVWNGKVQASSGKILNIEGWRFAANDSTDGIAAWTLSTRRGTLTAAQQRAKGGGGPMLENGVVLTARVDSPRSVFSVETQQGSFSFSAAEVPWGQPKPFLNDRVEVERIPNSIQLTTSVEEQDYPAVAQTNEAIYLAYIEFVHGDRSQARQGQLSEEPKDFKFLARPVGGDQVFLLRFDKVRRTWSAPLAVSAPGGDCMRTAVAVDGKKRVWVFWSAQFKGNFDLYARILANERWSSELRLTTDPGTDLNPVAKADSKGRIWLAWQGFRKGNLEILTAAQNNNRFGPETVISFSRASDWDPAIAAAPNGEIAVSWDTYDKGDYDVYFRRLQWDDSSKRIRLQEPVPAAASLNFEARSSIAFDPQSRVWVAYEAADVKWGKDFGAYEKSGVALYRGHSVRLKRFEGNESSTTEASLSEALPGMPTEQVSTRRGRRAAAKAAAAKTERAPNTTGYAPVGPLHSFPRVAVDPSGMVLLAYRTPVGIERSTVGTVWQQYFSYFDGSQWQGPIPIDATDGLLDSRPAILTTGPGNFLLAGTTDHRQSQQRRGARRIGDGVQTDLSVAEIRLDAAAQQLQLSKPVRETVAAKQTEVQPELDQVTAMHAYRVKLGGQEYRLLRGEFHRHTEISGDGGRDGPVIDAYRYMIDAAYMDWGGCCDHDNGGGREYFWWIEQKLTDAYRLSGRFMPMFSYERSVRYPEGHRNVVFPQRGIRPLPRLPKVADDAPPAPAPDTQMLYSYLKQFNGIAASHTSGTDMGTDWRDNDPRLEPVVEIYQGDRQNYEMPDAPRSNSANDSIGGWRPLGFVSLALQKGYRLGFQSSSDHISTHMSYCNLWVTEPTREAIMEAFVKRRVYGATDNILADVRCAGHFMGEEFSIQEPPSFSVKLTGMAPFAKVHIIKDSKYVYSVEPGRREVDFTWRDAAAEKGKTSYYYVRGEQTDGELVWVSPMWITYK